LQREREQKVLKGWEGKGEERLGWGRKMSRRYEGRRGKCEKPLKTLILKKICFSPLKTLILKKI